MIDESNELERLRRFRRSIEACAEFYDDGRSVVAVIDAEQFEFLLEEADGFKELQ